MVLSDAGKGILLCLLMSFYQQAQALELQGKLMLARHIMQSKVTTEREEAMEGGTFCWSRRAHHSTNYCLVKFWRSGLGLTEKLRQQFPGVQ